MINDEARATLYTDIRPIIISGENERLAAMSSVLAVGQVDGKAIIPVKWPASSKRTSSSRLNSRRGKRMQRKEVRGDYTYSISRKLLLYTRLDTSLKLRPRCVNPVGGNP